MSALIPFYITAFDKGFINNKKPFLIPDEAFSTLENAYVWRDRVLKRQGLKLIGRLRRNIEPAVTLSTQANGAQYVNADILADSSINVRSPAPPALSEPNAQIEPETLTVTVGAITFTDVSGTGVLTGTGANTGNINYQTGQLILNFSPALGAPANVNVTLHYFPTLPVMGISLRDVAALNDEQTVWFDQKYAYIWSGVAFDEFIPGTTWSGTDSDFFWTWNYRGAAPQDKIFFATNFTNPPNANNPIRYTNPTATAWNAFAPLITATDTLYQARIIISYYNRLVLLNTWEGTTIGGYGGAVNIQNRCAFSQLGDPLAVNAFRRDIFGKGGVIDAPTSEAIVGAMFVKNTLIVLFEETTWQLTYVGEYGTPFVWERISADFGSESTFSSVLFDNHMLAVGDTAIIAANAINANRIDLDIPDQVFQISNINDGPLRVWGVRDYQRELVFWNYPDGQTEASPGVPLIFPNKVLLYNYRNNTWAIFRDNVTAFGTFRLNPNINWDSTDITWDDNDVTWDDVDTQEHFPSIVSGNQQGFVHLYGYKTPDDVSLSIEGIDISVTPIVITSVNHNLQDLEIIELLGIQFVDSSATPETILPTDLNGKTYQVMVLTKDTFSISKWDGVSYVNNFAFTPAPTNAEYVGGGTIVLFPKLNAQTKDINVFQDKGMQVKLSYLDFLMEPTDNSAFSVVLALNATLGLPPAVVGNLSTTSNTSTSTVLNSPFYTPDSDYAWFRFFATTNAQFFRIIMTYNDDLMNDLNTHAQPWTLYAMTAYVRPGGRVPFS